MPAIQCKCGNRLGFGEIPNPIEWLTISDVEYDNFTGVIDAEKLYADMKSMLLCDQCGRIFIFWKGFQSPPTSYAKENS